mmetsp:Transcript_28119/g.86191  ORF Transcript_28119/g.86191 Transcript_28119/m.86191 type:complete len:102 (+) Transcript_28119:698-1003(+)
MRGALDVDRAFGESKQPSPGAAPTRPSIPTTSASKASARDLSSSPATELALVDSLANLANDADSRLHECAALFCTDHGVKFLERQIPRRQLDAITPAVLRV